MSQGRDKFQTPAQAPTGQGPTGVVELLIDTLGGQGDGIAVGPVFAPFTLPGERVSARVSGERAEVLEVLQPSADRIAPACPHFGACGGCALQHWAPRPYLDWKVAQIVLALERERLETQMLPAFATPPGSRRRLALHARPGNGPDARLGFKTRGGWQLAEIAVCPVADPRLVAALPGLRRLAAAFLEHPKSAPTLHVTCTDTGLDIDVTGVERRSGALSADARTRAGAAAAAMDAARVTQAGEMVFQARMPSVGIGRARVNLPPASFLQATPQAEKAMGDFICEALAGGARIADLFCGVGTFALRLAEFASVHAIDASAPAVAALAAAPGGAPGLKAVKVEARDLFRRPLLAQDMKKMDAAVFDPPRAGAQAQAAQLAASKLSRVIGVSCNPMTFAKDARTLVDAGFRLEQVLPVDQFLWSPHVELVGLFVR